MKTDFFQYNNTAVEFISTGNDVMVNATEIAKTFDKKVEAFMRNEQTQSFIFECLKSENSRFLGIEKEEDLFTSKQKSGTFMHRILALKFAAWLSPAFEVWVFTTIDKFLNENARLQKEALIEKLSTKQKKDLKKEELLEKYADNADLLEYFELERKESSAHRRRMRLNQNMREQVKLQLGF